MTVSAYAQTQKLVYKRKNEFSGGLRKRSRGPSVGGRGFSGSNYSRSNTKILKTLTPTGGGINVIPRKKFIIYG